MPKMCPWPELFRWVTGSNGVKIVNVSVQIEFSVQKSNNKHSILYETPISAYEQYCSSNLDIQKRCGWGQGDCYSDSPLKELQGGWTKLEPFPIYKYGCQTSSFSYSSTVMNVWHEFLDHAAILKPVPSALGRPKSGQKRNPTYSSNMGVKLHRFQTVSPLCLFEVNFWNMQQLWSRF